MHGDGSLPHDLFIYRMADAKETGRRETDGAESKKETNFETNPEVDLFQIGVTQVTLQKN